MLIILSQPSPRQATRVFCRPTSRLMAKFSSSKQALFETISESFVFKRWSSPLCSASVYRRWYTSSANSPPVGDRHKTASYLFELRREERDLLFGFSSFSLTQLKISLKSVDLCSKANFTRLKILTGLQGMTMRGRGHVRYMCSGSSLRAFCSVVDKNAMMKRSPTVVDGALPAHADMISIRLAKRIFLLSPIE